MDGKGRQGINKHLAILVGIVAAALIIGVIVVRNAHDDGGATGRTAGFKQTNLVSSVEKLAPTTDQNLMNPWGFAPVPGELLWVANNGTGTLTTYDGDGTPGPLTVTLAPTPRKGEEFAPTGLVFNPKNDEFIIRADKDDKDDKGDKGDKGGKAEAAAMLISDDENGRIVVVAPDISKTKAFEVVRTRDAVYKGLALANNRTQGNMLFATNFRSGKVETFDSKFQRKFEFTDTRLTKDGFAPFGIQNINGVLFVTFAKQDADKKDDVAGRGNGFVDVFDTEGKLIERFASGVPLNSPWGVAIAPHGFGKLGGEILIGNFGDGRINVFDNSGRFLGPLASPDRKPITIEGLWSLGFGTFKNADPTELYFTAGIQKEAQGLLGEIRSVSGKKD